MLTYGTYVWSAYGIAAAMLTILALRSWLCYRRAVKQAQDNTHV